MGKYYVRYIYLSSKVRSEIDSEDFDYLNPPSYGFWESTSDIKMALHSVLNNG